MNTKLHSKTATLLLILVLSIGLLAFAAFHVTSAQAAVVMTEFSVTPGNTQALVSWRTASEYNTSGFYVLRSNTLEGTYTRVRDEFIPRRGTGITGAFYEFVDSGLSNGVTYYYKIEIVNIDLTSIFTGALSVTPNLPTPTVTLTPTSTATVTRTPTVTSTSTVTVTGTVTGTTTITGTVTHTHTPTLTPTRTQTRTPTKTKTLVSYHYYTWTPSRTPTATRTSPYKSVTPTYIYQSVTAPGVVMTVTPGGATPTLESGYPVPGETGTQLSTQAITTSYPTAQMTSTAKGGFVVTAKVSTKTSTPTGGSSGNEAPSSGVLALVLGLLAAVSGLGFAFWKLGLFARLVAWVDQLIQK